MSYQTFSQHARDGASQPPIMLDLPDGNLGFAEINDLLQLVHRPTACISTSMASLAAFPKIDSLADAAIQSVCVSASSSGRYDASLTHRTSAAPADVEAFYEAERVASRAPSLLMVTAHEARGGASVKISASYPDACGANLVRRYGQWHGGTNPFADQEPVGVEISTFHNGDQPSFIALYTTRFSFADVPVAQLQGSLECQLRDLGWTSKQPRPGSLFLRGPFDAEVHIRTRGNASTVVDFVGEFEVKKLVP